MKKNATVESLAQQAWDNGNAKKGMYSVSREENVLTLSIRETKLASFRVTGFEQGIVEYSDAKTDAQKAAIDTFVSYFQGA